MPATWAERNEKYVSRVLHGGTAKTESIGGCLAGLAALASNGFSDDQNTWPSVEQLSDLIWCRAKSASISKGILMLAKLSSAFAGSAAGKALRDIGSAWPRAIGYATVQLKAEDAKNKQPAKEKLTNVLKGNMRQITTGLFVRILREVDNAVASTPNQDAVGAPTNIDEIQYIWAAKDAPKTDQKVQVDLTADADMAATVTRAPASAIAAATAAQKQQQQQQQQRQSAQKPPSPAKRKADAVEESQPSAKRARTDAGAPAPAPAPSAPSTSVAPSADLITTQLAADLRREITTASATAHATIETHNVTIGSRLSLLEGQQKQALGDLRTALHDWHSALETEVKHNHAEHGNRLHILSVELGAAQTALLSQTRLNAGYSTALAQIGTRVTALETTFAQMFKSMQHLFTQPHLAPNRAPADQPANTNVDA